MPEPNEPLSEREREILRLVATGAANKEIARQLVISPNTVKVHLRNIFTKTGVSSRTEATLYAVQMGLVSTSAVKGSPEESAGYELVGLPGITIDGNGTSTDNASDASPESRVPARRSRAWKAWQIGLAAVLVALILIGSGAFIARMIAPAPTAVPTVASKSATSLPNLVIRRWAQKTALPAAREGMGVAEYEGRFYLIGGQTAGGPDGRVQRFDPQKNAWETLASKPTPVTDVQAALLGEKIYVPGGLLSDGKASDRLEVYNPRQNTWENRAPLPEPVSGYALAPLDGKLYILGGKSGGRYLSAVYIYDPQEDRWKEGTAMRAPRAYSAAAVVDGKIQIIGGFDGTHALDLNQAYIPSRDGSGEDPWETRAALPKGRYALRATYMAGIVFILGGLDDQAKPASPDTIQYLVQTDSWGTFDAPPLDIGASPAIVASGNFIYAMGGKTPAGLSTANQAYQAIYTISVPILRSDGQ